jgi:hypothetical protein
MERARDCLETRGGILGLQYLVPPYPQLLSPTVKYLPHVVDVAYDDCEVKVVRHEKVKRYRYCRLGTTPSTL